VVQKCGLAEDRSSGWCRNLDWLRTDQVGGAEIWTGWGQVKWIVQKCGLAEDRSSGWRRNVDWLRTGQVGGAEMWTG